MSEWVSDATFDFITRVTSSLHVRFFLLCCHSDTAYNKRLLSSLKPYALFVFFLLATRKQTNRDTHAHPAPHKHTHTHTLGRTKRHKHTHLLLLSYKCSCTPKRQCKWHYYNTREHPVTILYDELSQAGMPVNLLENRSLYWDIHQSHHCGLPDAARAHQDIRYWKLTGGFGNNKNISPDASAVSRPDTAAMLHAGWYDCMNAAVVFWGVFFGQFEDRKRETFGS